MFESVQKEYLHALRVRNLSEGTITYREIYLNRFATFLQKENIESLHDLMRAHVYAYAVALTREGWTSGTISHVLSTLGSFLKFCFDRGVIASDLSVFVTFPKKQPRNVKNILSEAEMTRFLALPDTRSPRGLRDKAMLELLYSTAIRREELILLNLYDFSEQEGILRVFGKGRKERIVPVGSVAITWLKKYLNEMRRYYTQPKEQALFISITYGRRLTREYINLLIAQYCKQGKLKNKTSPHTFRHSCATHLLRGGADIRHVQELLGHSSARTTEIYTHLDITDLKAVFKRTHPRGGAPNVAEQKQTRYPSRR
jgi:integrase/recombinase XerD